MASLDDILDASERLDKEHYDYVIIALQKGDKKYKSDIFLGIEDKESRDIMGLLIESVYAHIHERDFFKKNKKKRPPK